MPCQDQAGCCWCIGNTGGSPGPGPPSPSGGLSWRTGSEHAKANAQTPSAARILIEKVTAAMSHFRLKVGSRGRRQRAAIESPPDHSTTGIGLLQQDDLPDLIRLTDSHPHEVKSRRQIETALILGVPAKLMLSRGELTVVKNLHAPPGDIEDLHPDGRRLREPQVEDSGTNNRVPTVRREPGDWCVSRTIPSA